MTMARSNVRRIALAALGMTGVLAVAMPAAAHHSFGAFDRTKEMTVTGTVKVWMWTNPHPSMTIVAPDATGKDVSYVFEFGAPVQLQEKGYTRKMVAIGDKVKTTYNPWRSGNPGGLFQDITTPDGKSLKVAAAAH